MPSGAAVTSAGLLSISALLLLTGLYVSPAWGDHRSVGRPQTFERNHHEKVANTTTTQPPSPDAGSSECAAAVAPESRFDCARDRPLSREGCQERGCCYAPLMLADGERPSLTSGPPWCYYPPSYSGYRMGPLTPTRRGRGATLVRPTPSYLPRDISTLRLEVIEETANCFHLTVSLWKLVTYIYIYI